MNQLAIESSKKNTNMTQELKGQSKAQKLTGKSNKYGYKEKLK